MERYKKKFKESDHTLISNASKNEWANRTFSKEIKNLNPSDIVWLQDKKSKYQGFYKVNSKNKFETIGSMPQQIPYRILNSAPIFKEQKLKENFDFDIMNVFENNINGYGGPGIDHLAQYNRVILLIINHITKDTIEVLDSISGPEEDSVVNEYSEKDKIKLKKIVSELKKLRI